MVARGDPPVNNVQAHLQNYYRNATSVGPSDPWVCDRLGRD